MNHNKSKGELTVLGIDLAKHSFQLHGINTIEPSSIIAIIWATAIPNK